VNDRVVVPDCAERKLHPAASRQTSHCYFPIAFLTQPPVPFRMSLISMAFVTDGICGIHDFTPGPLRRKQTVGLSENGKTCHFLAFLWLFVGFCRAFVRRNLNCHENVTPTGI
jgi:hypothetical protein